MSVITNDERSLLDRAAGFDESALSEIYDCHQEALYRYAMRLLGDQQLAEDCIADTFLRFLKALSRGIIPQENLRAYLYRISHNWITDYYRRNARNNEQDLKEYIPSKKDLAEEVEKEMQGESVRSAILTLTPEQQQVIILKYFEGWQNAEIAQFTGKRVGAVKALLHRSLASLKNRVEEKGN